MRFFLYLIAVMSVLVASMVVGSFYLYHAPRDYAETTVIIPLHSGARGAIGQLHEAGLVPSLPWMVVPLLVTHQTGALKAGEYAFPAGLTPAQIISKIAHGEVVVHKVTIPEGWNTYQVRMILLAEPLLTGELGIIPEGSIYPDTIHFTRGETRAAVVARMQAAQQTMLNQLWQTRAADLPLQSPAQLLVLASIVEKETGLAEERAKVAGVFYNRLRIGMKLQSDPTVVYGIEAQRGGLPMGRPLSKADLMTDTVYNSYTREGLPPTPICNPGKAAIMAVLHPEQTDALYFVATGHGGHNFAASLETHDENVATYRKATKPPALVVVAKAKKKKRHK